MTECKPSTVPLTANVNVSLENDEEHKEFKALNINYCSAVFLINYIACLTRPDLSFAVSSLARFCEKPGIQHWREVKRCWKYLKATKDLKLTLQINHTNPQIQCFSDATWSDDLDTRRLQSGHLLLLFDSLISWSSYCQRNVTHSTTKAELNPLVDSFLEAIWMRGLVSELWKTKITPSCHFIDNKGLDDKLKKFGCNSKTRHINIKTKALQEELKLGNLEIELIQAHNMKADGLTKALPLCSLITLLCLINPDFSAPTLVLRVTGGVE